MRNCQWDRDIQPQFPVPDTVVFFSTPHRCKKANCGVIPIQVITFHRSRTKQSTIAAYAIRTTHTTNAKLSLQDSARYLDSVFTTRIPRAACSGSVMTVGVLNWFPVWKKWPLMRHRLCGIDGGEYACITRCIISIDSNAKVKRYRSAKSESKIWAWFLIIFLKMQILSICYCKII